MKNQSDNLTVTCLLRSCRYYHGLSNNGLRPFSDAAATRGCIYENKRYFQNRVVYKNTFITSLGTLTLWFRASQISLKLSTSGKVNLFHLTLHTPLSLFTSSGEPFLNLILLLLTWRKDPVFHSTLQILLVLFT